MFLEGETALEIGFGTVVGQEFSRMRVHDGLALEGPNVSMPYFFDYRSEAAKDGVDGWSVTRSSVDQINEIMGVRAKDARIEGFQFHPESIFTHTGHDLLKNFLTRH